MLSRVRLFNNDGHTNRSVLVDVAGNSTGYFLKSITGLEPPQARAAYNEYAVLDGGIFSNIRQEPRNIVINIGLEPNRSNLETVLELRRHLYVVAGTKKRVRVDLYEDGSWFSYIWGYVETIEPEVFSREPGVQVSIICMEPDLLKPTSESVTSTSGTNNTMVIDYQGDANAGFTTHITARTSLSYVELRDHVMENSFRVTHPISSGEYVSIISSDNNRRVDHRRSNGTLIARLIDGISTGSEWPTLRYGENRFSAHPAATPSSDVTLTYRERYSGF